MTLNPKSFRIPSILRDLTKRVQKIKASSILFTVYSDKGVQDFIVDVNKILQLHNQGEDIFGNIIGTYSAKSEELDSSKVAGQPYNFKQTGKFFKAFKIKVFKDGSFRVVNNDVKHVDNDSAGESFELAEIYPNILGIQKDNIGSIIERILQGVINETRKRIRG